MTATTATSPDPAVRGDRFAPSEPRRREYLRLVTLGHSHKEVQAELGIARQSYLAWRKRFPEWKAEVDAALSRGKVARNRKKVNDGGIETDAPFDVKRSYYLGYQSYWHHQQMQAAMENCPPGGIIMVLVPPEHGKTTWVADWITMLIAEDPNVRIGYISETLNLSKKAAGRQRTRLEGDGAKRHPNLHADYGPFHDIGRSNKPWSANYFTVLKADHDEQDYTFEARGATGQIAGTRLDHLFIDDLQSLNNINDTKSLLAKIRQDFLSRVNPNHGRTMIVGTRVEEIDVYSELIEAGIIDELVCLPATNGVVVECPLGDKCEVKEIPHEEPLCPEMWNIHAMAKKRKIVGETAWARNWQQRPSDVAESTFTEAIVHGCRDQATKRVDVIPRQRTWRRFAALDPALTGGCALAGFHACATHLRVVGLVRRFNLARSENIIAMIGEMYEAWGGFNDLIIEANAYQKALVSDERLLVWARAKGVRIHPHFTGAGHNGKLDPDLGVAQMASTMADREMSWIYGDRILVDEMATLETELLKWRPYVPVKKLRQDTVMALWFGWLWWRKRKKEWATQDVKTQTFRTRGTPWRPMGYAAVRAIGTPVRQPIVQRRAM